MKAFIVKNDEFKTIGFQVEDNNGHTLFSWGISHNSPFYFVKELNAEDYINTIFRLVQVQASLDEYGYRGHNFVTLWFRIAQEGNYLKKGVDAVKMTQLDETIERLDKELKRLIESIK